jgi:HAD superfamily hydrolase (TIGR01509 family)
MIRALIFDFDGLMLDTEMPEYQAWSEVYADYGQELTINAWGACIGSTYDRFDPYGHIEQLTGTTIDREAVTSRIWQRHVELLEGHDLLPGVRAYLADAQRLGLELAIASSSLGRHVNGHLERLGIAEIFPVVVTRDKVAKPKPAPDLFTVAAKRVEVEPHESLAFEDSPHGIRAAHDAGMFCIAVPNEITRHLDVSLADIILESLADVSLPDLLRRVMQEKTG